MSLFLVWRISILIKCRLWNAAIKQCNMVDLVKNEISEPFGECAAAVVITILGIWEKRSFAKDNFSIRKIYNFHKSRITILF